MCFNFTNITVFVCISEIHTKYTRNPYFSPKIYGDLMKFKFKAVLLLTRTILLLFKKISNKTLFN